MDTECDQLDSHLSCIPDKTNHNLKRRLNQLKLWSTFYYTSGRLIIMLSLFSLLEFFSLPHATEAFGAEKWYSSCSFSNLALDGGEWSASRPGRGLAPG
jgi:hypothetical protein